MFQHKRGIAGTSGNVCMMALGPIVDLVLNNIGTKTVLQIAMHYLEGFRLQNIWLPHSAYHWSTKHVVEENDKVGIQILRREVKLFNCKCKTPNSHTTTTTTYKFWYYQPMIWDYVRSLYVGSLGLYGSPLQNIRCLIRNACPYSVSR